MGCYAPPRVIDALGPRVFNVGPCYGGESFLCVQCIINLFNWGAPSIQADG